MDYLFYRFELPGPDQLIGSLAMPEIRPCLPGIDCLACKTNGHTRVVWRPGLNCSKKSVLTPPQSESLKTVSVEEFRKILAFCEPNSLPIYPGTFLGDEPVIVPEKGPWMSCFSAKHLKKRQPLITAGYSVAVNEQLAEAMGSDDSVIMTPVVLQSAAISHTYYVPELAGTNLWTSAEYEENRIHLCQECGCHNFGTGVGTYKVRQYESRFASDAAKLYYCMERNSLVVNSAMKSRMEKAEPKLKFSLAGKI